MKIEIREVPHKTVFVWLSAEEAADEVLMTSLRANYAKWRARGFLPVVFESGRGDLENSMYQLMKHNYQTIAKNKLE